MDDFSTTSAADLAGRTRAGTLSVSEIAEEVIARHAHRDAAVRAFSYFEPAEIRRQAARLDAGGDRGPLHGVPVGVKDVINTRDMPTEHHNARYAGSRPGVDAACVDTLRSAGALLVGKTVTTEFAATPVGGPTRNPLDPERTPGGSSSGSAAAVADGQAHLGLGTQTGGSTIRPASFCGVYGWKPTWNSISREGLKMYSATCDTLGLYARHAADLALLADVFALDEPDLPSPDAVAGLRVAVCRTPMWDRAETATRDALRTGADALSNAGAELIDLELTGEFGDVPEAHRVILDREGRSAFLNEYRSTPEIGDFFTAVVENRTGVTSQQCREAYRIADSARARLDGLLADVDVVLAPSAVGEAPHGIENTGDPSFNAFWTLMQVPVVNVPGQVGPAGMPVGLSVIGRRYDDRRVIAAAGLVGRVWS